MLNSKITFIGSGFMAGATVRGIVESGSMSKENIFVVNPADTAGRDELCEKYGVNAADESVISDSDIVFLAVKPQTFPEVCEMYRDYFRPDSVYLTIMAGISTETVSRGVGSKKVVRFMPNLALSVKKSATGFCIGEGCGDNERNIAKEIFEPLGVLKELPESKISAVTALSGSGPAYFYYLCEAMIDAAVSDGMDEETARALAVQTFIGTAKLIEDSGESPIEMRRRITSKKGTTEAGINAMGANGFFDDVNKGYIAARDRSDELAQGK